MSLIENWYNPLLKILFHPKDFFKKMPNTGGYTNPLRFAITNIFIANLLGLVFMVLSRDVSFQKLSQTLGFEMGVVYTIPILIVVIFIFSLVIQVIWLFIGAGITHLFLKLFGAKNGYESTFRVFASVTVFYIISSISYFDISGLGIVNIAIAIYYLYVLVIGYSEVHKITTSRSLAAVLSPILILFIFMIILVILYIQLFSGSNLMMSQDIYSDSRGLCAQGASGFPIVNALTLYKNEYQIFKDGSAVIMVRNNIDRQVILKGVTADGIPVIDINQVIDSDTSYLIPSTTLVPGTFPKGKEGGCYNGLNVKFTYDVVDGTENTISAGILSGRYY